MAFNILHILFLPLSFGQSHTCFFSLSILHTSSSYIIFLVIFSQETISIKIRNFICFCSFDLSSPIFEKDNFIDIFYIVLSY